MKGWLRKVGAGMAVLALGVPGAGPALAQDAAQVRMRRRAALC